MVGWFLVWWNFENWGVKWLKWLKNKGFYDMGYDKGLGREDWVFWLILLGFWKVRFLSWCVDESAIWIPEKTSCGSGFCYPLYPKNVGISSFFRPFGNRTSVRYNQVWTV